MIFGLKNNESGEARRKMFSKKKLQIILQFLEQNRQKMSYENRKQFRKNLTQKGGSTEFQNNPTYAASSKIAADRLSKTFYQL